VEFCPGISHLELVKLLGGAVAGLHSMLDEHFGISIVEYMAAGELSDHKPTTNDSCALYDGSYRTQIMRGQHSWTRALDSFRCAVVDSSHL
jgi:hypothetical protein